MFNKGALEEKLRQNQLAGEADAAKETQSDLNQIKTDFLEISKKLCCLTIFHNSNYYDQEEHRGIIEATQPLPQASTTPCLADRSDHHIVNNDYDRQRQK